MVLGILMLVAGLVMTAYGADWLVDGASALAKKLNVSPLAIGLTVVAFGTSLPEFVVSFISALNHNTDLAVSNVVGSNIFNTLLILGIIAVIRPITLQVSTIYKEIPFSLLAAIVLLIIVSENYLGGIAAQSAISRADGLILLAFFIIFIYYTFSSARNQPPESTGIKDWKMGRSVLVVLLGITTLILGGKLLVNGAVDIATILGVSEAVIGLTIVSVGTSVPELSTSIVAARKNRPDIAVGNVIGSNIFNIFFILGCSASVYSFQFSEHLFVDLIVCAVSSLLVFIFMFIGTRRTLSKMDGIFFLVLYLIYLLYLLLREIHLVGE
jgi:cation:H+ antiporter